jgi:Pyruvate/2-oxoacid:ferredoxin oxidoreductase delta subunit
MTVVFVATTMSNDRIQSKPSEALSYNPGEAKYWDRAGLARELERVYDLCRGCRLCFNLCPSFPALFDAIDKQGDEVRNLTKEETWRVIDLCYGCKLCEVKCPYTPRDGHEFQLDFPRLMIRAKAIRAREDGIGLREKVLGNPDLLGKISSLPLGWTTGDAVRNSSAG